MSALPPRGGHSSAALSMTASRKRQDAATAAWEFLEGSEAGAKGRTPSPARRSYFLRLRSQISAAIDPTTPIAAIPEKASISGTAVA